MKYIIKRHSNLHAEIFDNEDKSLGKLDYKCIGGTDYVTLNDGQLYTLDYGNPIYTYKLTESRKIIASTKFKWVNNQITIFWEDGNEYVLKSVNFFKGHFGLFDKNNNEIAEIRFSFKPLSTYGEYTIETNKELISSNNTLLIFFIAHIVNAGGVLPKWF